MPHAVTRPNLYAPRPRPMGEMNVTPFIDVLLVLLIMLILAIPAPVHVTPVDLPDDRARPIHPVLAENTIRIDAADRLLWNGAPVSPAILRAQVAAASAEEHPALLRFAPDANASYDTAARTIALIKEEGAKSFAFVGNEQHRNFGI
jgi:biopolymer transport protein ExbD